MINIILFARVWLDRVFAVMGVSRECRCIPWTLNCNNGCYFRIYVVVLIVCYFQVGIILMWLLLFRVHAFSNWLSCSF